MTLMILMMTAFATTGPVHETEVPTTRDIHVDIPGIVDDDTDFEFNSVTYLNTPDWLCTSSDAYRGYCWTGISEDSEGFFENAPTTTYLSLNYSVVGGGWPQNTGTPHTIYKEYTFEVRQRFWRGYPNDNAGMHADIGTLTCDFEIPCTGPLGTNCDAPVGGTDCSKVADPSLWIGYACRIKSTSGDCDEN